MKNSGHIVQPARRFFLSLNDELKVVRPSAQH